MNWMTAYNIIDNKDISNIQVNDDIKITNGFDIFKAKVQQVNDYNIECNIEPLSNKIVISKHHKSFSNEGEEYENIMKLLYQFTDSFTNLEKLEMMLNNLTASKPEYIDQIFYDLQLIQQ